jgi:peptidoglycan hydrolase-like protein with peptidoglycan-binding domain
MGGQNDAEEVRRLQEFLNTEIGAGLPVTGFFGPMTEAAVNAFQLKYSEDVLAPWVPYGLPSAQTPTGYVYKTTQTKINNIFCPSLNLSVPPLP